MKDKVWTQEEIKVMWDKWCKYMNEDGMGIHEAYKKANAIEGKINIDEYDVNGYVGSKEV